MWTKIPVFLLLFASGLVAQVSGTSAGSTSPLSVSGVIRPTSAQNPYLEFDLINNGQKPITAYTIAMECFDSSGKRAFKKNKTDLAEETTPTGRGVFQPGETRHLKVKLLVTKDGSLISSNCQIVADYAVFTDGSSWGPDKLKSSTRIQAMRDGMAMEKARAKSERR